MRKEELEITRHNVTPGQFALYVRQQIKKHNFSTVCAMDIDTKYWKNGGDLEFDINASDPAEHPVKAEKSISKPYEMQTYIRNWDRTVYNLIMEFTFDDEKKGTGYFYFICTWKDETETEETAAEQTEETAEAEQTEQQPEQAAETEEQAATTASQGTERKERKIMFEYRFTFTCIDNGGFRQCFTVRAMDKKEAITKGLARARRNAKGDLNNWDCKLQPSFR